MFEKGFYCVKEEDSYSYCQLEDLIRYSDSTTAKINFFVVQGVEQWPIPEV